MHCCSSKTRANLQKLISYSYSTPLKTLKTDLTLSATNIFFFILLTSVIFSYKKNNAFVIDIQYSDDTVFQME